MVSSPIKDDIYGQKKKFEELLNIFDGLILNVVEFDSLEISDSRGNVLKTKDKRQK